MRIRSAKRSDYLLVLCLAAFHTLMQVINGVRSYAFHQVEERDFELLSVLRDQLGGYVVGLCFIVLIVLTTRFLLSRQWPWWKIMGVHLVIGVLFSALWYGSLTLVWRLFCVGDCSEPLLSWVYWYLINLDKLILLYTVTASVTYLYHYMQRTSEYRLQQTQLTSQLAEARLHGLRAQLHPHFLFNTLNSIASLMDEDRSAAKRMIGELGGLLRHVLREEQRQLTTLDEELELLERYVYIEKTRFADDLTVSWDIEPDLEDLPVPSMILQPLVENAIKHGFSRDHLNVHIRISARRQGQRLVLAVCDDGQGLQGDGFSTGSGLRITRERLRTLYGDGFSFTVEDTFPGVCCTISLPVNTPAHAYAHH